jgi:hypothetical protein
MHQHQDRRQMTTYTDNHEQCPSNWTSEQINFIVGSKIMNESSMDTNLDKIDINQKNKQTKNQRRNSQNKYSQSPQHPQRLLREHTPKQTKTNGHWRDGETTTCSGHKTHTRSLSHHQSLPGPHTCSPPPTKRHTEWTPFDNNTPS